MQALAHASIAALVGLLISALPLLAAIVYAVRPTDRTLALIRPLSRAGTLSAVAGLLLALINGLLAFRRQPSPPDPVAYAALGLSEGLVPSFIAFVLLSAAWLVVAIGQRRQP